MVERARCSRRGCEPVPWVFLATDAPSYMSGPNLLRAKTGRERRDLGDGRGVAKSGRIGNAAEWTTPRAM